MVHVAFVVCSSDRRAGLADRGQRLPRQIKELHLLRRAPVAHEEPLAKNPQAPRIVEPLPDQRLRLLRDKRLSRIRQVERRIAFDVLVGDHEQFAARQKRHAFRRWHRHRGGELSLVRIDHEQLLFIRQADDGHVVKHGHAGTRHVFPVLALVAVDLEMATVGVLPQLEVLIKRRRAEGLHLRAGLRPCIPRKPLRAAPAAAHAIASCPSQFLPGGGIEIDHAVADLAHGARHEQPLRLRDEHEVARRRVVVEPAAGAGDGFPGGRAAGVDREFVADVDGVVHESPRGVAARLGKGELLDAVGVVAVNGHPLHFLLGQAVPRHGVRPRRKHLRPKEIPHPLALGIVHDDRHRLRLVERERHGHHDRLGSVVLCLRGPRRRSRLGGGDRRQQARLNLVCLLGRELPQFDPAKERLEVLVRLHAVAKDQQPELQQMPIPVGGIDVKDNAGLPPALRIGLRGL